MFNKLISYYYRWRLDNNEILFLNEIKRNSVELEPCVLVQMPPDYFYLCLFYMTVTQVYPQKKILGLWPLNVISSPRNERFKFLRLPIRRILNRIDFSKWKKLYSSIGIGVFVSLEAGPVKTILNWWVAHKIWRGLREKEDVLALVLNGTHCGDLIYDTYMRFRAQPTVDVNDPYLRYVIAQSLNAQTSIRKLLAERSVDVFLSSYSSYIQHGIPVREALRAGLKVYTAGTLSQYFKQLKPNDALHIPAHWCYKTQFEALAEPAVAKAGAREQLNIRFRGAVDPATFYMKTSAYASNDLPMPSGVEGVVFLHDFFDSPHGYRHMLFPDLWEWANFTLNLIESENLPIAVKPHPNQLPESLLVVEQFKKKFPGVQWIDPQTSNLTIFRSGIKCGISVYGTVLHELAYQGIPALAAGDHPHVAFEIAITPISVEDYRHYLINFRSLTSPSNVQEEVLSFYYMNNMHSNEDLPVDLAHINLRSLEHSDSIALARFLKMV